MNKLDSNQGTFLRTTRGTMEITHRLKRKTTSAPVTLTKRQMRTTWKCDQYKEIDEILFASHQIRAALGSSSLAGSAGESCGPISTSFAVELASRSSGRQPYL